MRIQVDSDLFFLPLDVSGSKSEKFFGASCHGRSVVGGRWYGAG